MIKASQKLVGKRFFHCSPSINEGLDCFTMCIEYLKMKGAEFSKNQEYKGYKIFDYKEIYAQDAFTTMQLAADFLSSIMREIKPGYEFAGDILIMRLKKFGRKRPLHFGICAGNGQVIVAVRDDSVRILNKKLFDVEKALRWE